jgi:hypothetical protein
MNIEIVKITDPGVNNQERLDLKVISSDNVGAYVVIDTI